MDRFWNGVRWVLVLPGALVANVLAWYANWYFVRFPLTLLRFRPLVTLDELVIAIVGGVVLVRAGLWISPSRHPALGFVLAALVVLFAGMGIILWLDGGSGTDALYVLLSACGAAVFAYQHSRLYAQEKGLERLRETL